MLKNLEVKVVREGEGYPIWLAHSLYETKLSEVSVAVFKMTSPANTLLAPPHKHPFDEILLVTKGTVFEYTIDPERVVHQLEAGDLIFLPADTVEGFYTLDEPAEMYWFMMGDEGTSLSFFETVGIPVPDQQHTLPPADYKTPDIETLRREGESTGFGQVV